MMLLLQVFDPAFYLTQALIEMFVRELDAFSLALLEIIDSKGKRDPSKEELEH